MPRFSDACRLVAGVIRSPDDSVVALFRFEGGNAYERGRDRQLPLRAKPTNKVRPIHPGEILRKEVRLGQGSDATSASTEIKLATVTLSLDASIFVEEGKGDFALAAGQADTLIDTARTRQEEADAGILRAAIHLLQGEPDLASTLLERMLTLVPGPELSALHRPSALQHLPRRQWR